MNKLDLIGDKATKMMMAATIMTMSPKTATITFKEEVTRQIEECHQMVEVTMEMTTDSKTMVIRIKMTFSKMKVGL